MRVDPGSACPQWRALHAGLRAVPEGLLSLAQPRARHRARAARFHRHLSPMLRELGGMDRAGLCRELRRHERQRANSTRNISSMRRCWPRPTSSTSRISTTSSSCASKQRLLLDHLARGGHMVICSEPALPVAAVPQRLRGRAAAALHQHQGAGAQRSAWLLQQHGPGCSTAGRASSASTRRGWSRMPGAVWLTDVGSADDPKPARLAVAVPDRSTAGAAWCSCTMATT